MGNGLSTITAVLLDTQIFLWWFFDDPRLTPTATALLESAEVRKYVSVASVWEIAIKNGKGKLPLPEPVDISIANRLTVTGFEALPFHHNDPFDRILIAQSRVESIPLISADTAFTAYDLQLIP
jgi:PIN domain nuclease of toxin-antitoxin system